MSGIAPGGSVCESERDGPRERYAFELTTLASSESTRSSSDMRSCRQSFESRECDSPLSGGEASIWLSFAASASASTPVTSRLMASKLGNRRFGVVKKPTRTFCNLPQTYRVSTVSQFNSITGY